MIDLVIFDMDGVVFEGRNFWLDLHRAMGTEAKAWQLWRAYGQTDYARLAALTVEELWRGRDAAPFFRLVAARGYVEGVPDVFGWLRAQGVRTGIVSTGPRQLAERARRELGIDCIRANRVLIAEGRFTGALELLVDNNRKDQAAAIIQAELGAAPAATAVVGDTASDMKMAALARLTVAYDPDQPDLEADAVLPRGRLCDLIPILAPCVAGAMPADGSSAKRTR